MKILKEHRFDDSIEWDDFKEHLFKLRNAGATFGVLRNNHAMLVYCTQDKTVVLSNTNILGGVCDDCSTDVFDDVKINRYEIVSF